MTGQNPPAHSHSHSSDEEEDVDALLESLENEDDSVYRAQRLAQLNAELASAQHIRPDANAAAAAPRRVAEDSVYPTLTSDQTLLDLTTETKRCVVHFAHPDFARCGTMDAHMQRLAAAHYDVRFARVDVRNTPFVVEKLKIRVLPCVIGFKDGIAVERVLGFEGLAAGGRDGTDAISTATLEKRLLYKGIFSQARLKSEDDGSDGSDAESDEGGRSRGKRAIRRGNARYNRNDDDDDDDWD